MKKSYIQPAITLVKTDTESNILAGSGLADTFNETPDSEKEYVTDNILSKYNKSSGLWDTTWNTDDEDEE